MQNLVHCCCYFPCGLKILFLCTEVVNITEKLYNRVHLIAILAFMFFFRYIAYFGVVTSHKILFSCIGMSSLSCAKGSFLKLRW